MVEAAMVLPVTILLTAALLCLLVTFPVHLLEQIAGHETERDQQYEMKEVTQLRIRDSLLQAAGEAKEP